MAWDVELDDDFFAEYNDFTEDVQHNILSLSRLLQEYGPQLGRPHVDTLNGSKHSNMKELRFNVEKGVWRIAFAFDPKRKGILLVGGNKEGTSQKRFYKRLITKADERYDNHINKLKRE